MATTLPVPRRKARDVLSSLPNVALAMAADLAVFALWDADAVAADYADDLDSPLDPVVTDFTDIIRR